jgi:transcriptional regulator with XRE-family HTH domain
MNTCSHAQTLGAALSARRRRLHLTCAELARRCEMSEFDLRRIEHGRFAPSPSQAYQMAIELKIDPDTFCRLALQELLLRPAYLACLIHEG